MTSQLSSRLRPSYMFAVCPILSVDNFKGKLVATRDEAFPEFMTVTPQTNGIRGVAEFTPRL